MAWTDLKAAVANVIKTNGTQSITGSLLQTTLNSIIDQVGLNATFKGVADTSTNPGTPDGPVFYLASEAGVYANFGITLVSSGLFVFTRPSTTWVSTPVPLVLQKPNSISGITYIGDTSIVFRAGYVYHENTAIYYADQTVNFVDQISTQILTFNKTSKAFALVVATNFVASNNLICMGYINPAAKANHTFSLIRSNPSLLELRQNITTVISSEYSITDTAITIKAGYVFVNGNGIPIVEQVVSYQSTSLQILLFNKSTKLFSSITYTDLGSKGDSNIVFMGYIPPSTPTTHTVPFSKPRILDGEDYLERSVLGITGSTVSIAFKDYEDGFILNISSGTAILNQTNTCPVNTFSGSKTDNKMYLILLTKAGVVSLNEVGSSINRGDKIILGFISSTNRFYSIPSQPDHVTVTNTTLLNTEVLAKDFNTVLGLGDKFMDRTCLVKAGDLWTGVKVLCDGPGTIDVTSYRLDGTPIYNRNIAVVAGWNILTISTTVQTYDMFIGISGNTAQIKTIFPNSNNPNTYKLIGGVWTYSGYDFAYGLIVKESKNLTLEGRMATLEQATDSLTIEQLLLTYDNVQLEPREYVLTSPLVVPSGKKISGVRGKTIVRVPSTLKIGIDLRNVEDVVLENFTLIGAYNGTPIKSELQPVRSGILDTFDQAYTLPGIGYNTDLINGGVTVEYIPQIGININTCEKIEILGCEIKNFSHSGISNRLSGKNYRYAIKVQNNYINNCYIGIKVYDEAERSQYIANNVSLCQIGLLMDSGTNMFYATSFTANRIGMVMKNGWNHAHGEMTDCPFTHCSLFSFIAKDVAHGQVFNGCKIGYVDTEVGNDGNCVLIKKSRGIFFYNGKLINATVKFEDLFDLYATSYTVAGPDEFSNQYYELVTESVTPNGIHTFKGNSCNGASFVYPAGFLILKDNLKITGEDSSDINN